MQLDLAKALPGVPEILLKIQDKGDKEEEMKTSEKLDVLLPALWAFQGEMKTLIKNTQGQDGYRKFMYVDLPTIWETILPLLQKNRLMVIQPIEQENGADIINTTLYHTGGQFISSPGRVFSAVDKNPRAEGSSQTYSRRYYLVSFLGLQADVDDDAAKAMGNKTMDGKEISSTPPTTKQEFAKTASAVRSWKNSPQIKAPVKGEPEKAKTYAPGSDGF